MGPRQWPGHSLCLTVNRARSGDYNVALVDLDEGVRMMSRIEGHLSLPIGTRVKARIAQQDSGPVVVFEPLAEVQP